MGFSVLQKWSKKSVSSAPLTASKGMRVFTVQGTGGTVVTEETAIGAVDSSSGLRVPIVGNQYSVTAPYLCCNDVTTNTVSLNLVEVVCSYGYGQYAPPVAPLDEPEIIEWGYCTVTEEVDHDIDGNPIMNLCGDPLTGAKQTFYLDTLKITKNIAAFDLDLARTYRNTVNDAALTIYTAGTATVIPAGFMRCVSIIPTRPYKVADTYVPVAVSLEIADTNKLPHPFQWRMIHSGYQAFVKETNGANGWTGPTDANPVKGRLVFTDSKLSLAHPVRLDIAGKPMETGVYSVKRNHGLAMSSNFTNSTYASTFISHLAIAPDTTTSTDCVFLYFRKCKSASFATMFSMLGIT